jgi:hypothetical protein
MATREKELVRGKILHYLALVYPQPVTCLAIPSLWTS